MKLCSLGAGLTGRTPKPRMQSAITAQRIVPRCCAAETEFVLRGRTPMDIGRIPNSRLAANPSGAFDSESTLTRKRWFES